MITLTRVTAAGYKGLADVDLSFPERGSFLIEGRNEAGKSTLFDAIHFGLYGAPLVGDQADAVHYGGEEAGVRLGVQVGATRLNVSRSVRQTAKSLRADAELEVIRTTPGSDDDVEIIKGARAVTLRLHQELGGLTSEALLNSCLVAQKQLGRLETLNRASREEALTVLLNLGKLSDVHNRLRVKPEDEEQLRRARARVELARVTAELARLTEQRAALERTRRLVELRRTLDQLRLSTDAGAQARISVAAHTARLAALRQSLASVESVEAELARWQEVLHLAQRCRTTSDDLAQVQDRLATSQAAGARLPALHASLDRAHTARAAAQQLLETHLRAQSLVRDAARVAERLQERADLTARCGRLDEDLARLRKQHKDLQLQLAQLASLTTELEATRQRQDQLGQLQRRIAALQERRAQLDTLEQRAERGAALLTRWTEVRRTEESAQQARRLLDDLSLGVAGVEHIALAGSRLDGPTRRSTPPESGTGLRLRLLIDHPLTGGLALQLRLWPGGAELVEVRPVSLKEAERLTGSGVPMLSAGGELEAQRERLTLEDDLAALGEARPRDLAAAAQRISLLANGDKAARGRQDIATLEARCLEEARALRVEPALFTLDALPEAIAAALQHEAARQAELSVSAGRREGLQGQLAILTNNGKERRRELDECQLSLSRDSDESLQADRVRIQEEHATTTIQAQQLFLSLRAFLQEAAEASPVAPIGISGDAALQALPPLPDPASVTDGKEGAPSLRDALQRRTDALSGMVATVEQQVAERDQLATRAQQLAETLDGWQTRLRDALAGAPDASGKDDPALGIAHAETRVSAIQAQLASMRKDDLRAEEQVLQKAAGAAESELTRSEADATAFAADIRRLASELGHALPDDSPPHDLPAHVEAALPESAGALPSAGEVEQQLSDLAHSRGGLEQGARDARTTLGDEAPLPLADAAATLARIEEDVAARRRGQEIVATTRRRMIDKVLPDTIQNMCLLLPMLTAERYRYAELTSDYRLQVWDERKRGYVEKNLFSGGTQDQFSLALRLGFALAALPRELGTSPGFLFLDEPLSSFDRDRTEALVNLLTRGQVGTFFQQIFLISHSQSFDPALFSHHIVMEHGRVASTTLPGL